MAWDPAQLITLHNEIDKRVLSVLVMGKKGWPYHSYLTSTIRNHQDFQL